MGEQITQPRELHVKTPSTGEEDTDLRVEIDLDEERGPDQELDEASAESSQPKEQPGGVQTLGGIALTRRERDQIRENGIDLDAIK